MKIQQLKHPLRGLDVITMVVRLSFMLLVGAWLMSCGGGGSAPLADTDTSVAAKTSMIPSGDIACPYGGILVETGIDENSNGVLDADEVDAREKVCNGAPGDDSLISTTSEPIGVNCPNGGLRIDVGIDSNGNANLDPAEITQTGFVCDGDNGNIGWQVATLIEFDNAGRALKPQVAMDANGNAIAVWYQSDGTQNYIWASRYVPGIGWGKEERISRANANARTPLVAVDASGNAIMAWSQSDGTRNNIWANRYVPDNGWGAAELIETNDTGDAQISSVAVDDSGNALAVWLQSDGTRNYVLANRYAPNFGWGTTEAIETGDVGISSKPHVVIHSDGSAVAVWEKTVGTLNIWTSRYLPGVGWGTAEAIDSVSSGSGASQVAMDAGGNAMVTWIQWDGTRFNIWARRYVPGSGWGTAEMVKTPAGDARAPHVAMDASGNAVIVWKEFDGIRTENIWANRYIPDSGWGAAEIIETNSLHVQNPRVAMGGNSSAIVVWGQFDGTRENIWANRYMPGVGWGTAQLIETDNTGYARYPQVAMDTTGNAVAVWEQEGDGSRTDIWSNRWQAP